MTKNCSVTIAALVLFLGGALVVAGCGSEPSTSESTAASDNEAAETGLRVVDTATAAAIHQSRTEELVVLDVRTPEEFAAGHLDGATILDFYAEDFADQLAELDPNASYLLYCRSGNRSGQTRAMMEELGFTDVADIEGGIVAWDDAGLPVVRP